MELEAQIEPLSGPLPSIAWRWDPETDILSGSFRGTRKGGGLTGSVEVADGAGSIAVLEVASGVICGLDVVVWPEVETVPGLAVPGPLTDGRVVVPTAGQRTGIESLEVDAALGVATNPEESVFHFTIGPRRPVEVVRVADRFYLEVDQQHQLAGCWLTGVPAFPALEEE